MADRFDTATRSRIMSKIRSKDTKAEIILRKKLWGRGLRYRKHYDIIGKPDIAFPKKKVVIFVDGDFFHGYKWKAMGKKPPDGYWKNKIERNIGRDKKNNQKLKDLGWTVKRFWEHEIFDDIEKVIEEAESVISQKAFKR